MEENLISYRKIQKDHKQWFLGKSIDNYSIMGPWIVTKDEFVFPLEVNVQSKVNEEIRQDSNTKHMIVDIENKIVKISIKPNFCKKLEEEYGYKNLDGKSFNALYISFVEVFLLILIYF